MNNWMRFIRSSLTCQSPSDSIRFFKIASDRPIVRSHCPIFPPIRQTIKNLAMGRRLYRSLSLSEGFKGALSQKIINVRNCFEKKFAIKC